MCTKRGHWLGAGAVRRSSPTASAPGQRPLFLVINQICVTNLFYLSLEETWTVKMTHTNLKKSYSALYAVSMCMCINKVPTEKKVPAEKVPEKMNVKKMFRHF
jgi:hypothetical protein